MENVKLQLKTASHSGGCVPETSRGFRYWQPAPGWRTLPMLANPGNPSLSPHPLPPSPVGGRKAVTHHTDKTVEREGEQGTENSL